MNAREQTHLHVYARVLQHDKTTMDSRRKYIRVTENNINTEGCTYS